MRHLIVAAGMLVFGLVVTFGAASVLQFNAIAHANKSAEPFIIEASKSSAKPSRERTASTVRSAQNVRIVQASARF
jgi:hypothetical protein